MVQNRYDLSECLEYFQELKDEVYEKNGIIHGALLCDEDGFKTEYIGSQIVVVRLFVEAAMRSIRCSN